MRLRDAMSQKPLVVATTLVVALGLALGWQSWRLGQAQTLVGSHSAKLQTCEAQTVSLRQSIKGQNAAIAALQEAAATRSDRAGEEARRVLDSAAAQIRESDDWPVGAAAMNRWFDERWGR